ncbi:MAG: vitamin K epoxide reductase family protein [Acidobacteriaceae bacterium]
MSRLEELPARVETEGEALMLGACCTAIATLVVVSLYQLGKIDHLPDPPGNIFASEKITSSKVAHPLGIPDGLLGLASYGSTLALIVLSYRNTAYTRALGVKLALDAGAASVNSGRQVICFGKLCSWCTGTALATGVMAYAGRRRIVDSATSVARAVSIRA